MDVGRENERPPAKKRRLSLPDKLKHETEKHKLREPCKCAKLCSTKIVQRRRIDIYLKFWSISYNNRKTFIHSNVDIQETNPKQSSNRKREVSFDTEMI